MLNVMYLCDFHPGRGAKARPGRPEGFASAVDGVPPTAFRCAVSWPVAELASLASQRYAQTGGDKSVHEARCARGPRALCSSAPKRRPPTCPSAPLRQRWRLFSGTPNTVLLAAGGTRRGRFLGRRGAELRGRRACAIQQLTRRRLFERSETKSSEVSSTARPQGEHRSAVGVPADRPSMSPRRVPPATSRANPRRKTSLGRRR